VTRADLTAAWFVNQNYAQEVVAVFDADGDFQVSQTELALDSEAKVKVIAQRLSALGNENPRIVGEVEPYAIHHNVTHGQWAIAECSACHSEDSRLAQPMSLANFTPGGVQPEFIGDNFNGQLRQDVDGSLYFMPSTEIVSRYVLGHHRVDWIDTAEMLIFLGSLAGVVAHGGLRYLAVRRLPRPAEPELREVYMYTLYERQWHWLQSAVIFGLLFTGLVIHNPDQFALFNFQGIVLVHNALALILVINVALAAFYHLASGEIRQFLPEPHGFFGQMFAQAKYYIQGIFKGEPHPFEKTRERKMNPIQRLTYLGLLNVLLPLQVITGTLMWGAQHVPGLTEFFGGLPLLAPLHSLGSWLMATFIVVHVYMTTTGHTPLANIRAMIWGWDDVEVHPESAATQPKEA
jgi:thiosulfate reductase cytochrome b subunit